MITLHACLITSLSIGACFAPAPAPPPPLPGWATDAWVYDAAGIVAGETVPGCAECDLWVACTIFEDVTLRGYHPRCLRPAEEDKPGRWNGWLEPGERHYEAVMDALEGNCSGVPTCAFLGSLRDYDLGWRNSLASERRVFAIGNHHGAMACVQ